MASLNTRPLTPSPVSPTPTPSPGPSSLSQSHFQDEKEAYRQHQQQPPSQFTPRPASSLGPIHAHHHLTRNSTYSKHRGYRIASALKPWIPVLLYIATSLGFVIAIAFYKDEVFTALDELSDYLKQDEQYGQAIMFLLIFLTTIPPFPLYSTFIVLSGYTFGAWHGAVISYFSALTGALAVFLLSRSPLLRPSISRWLACTITLKRVVCAVERKPTLLFLIRLAPYPYNVMNCLLAAAPRLSLGTYTGCTALSLFKVIIHTSLGAGVHSFKGHYASPSSPSSSSKNPSPSTPTEISGLRTGEVPFGSPPQQTHGLLPPTGDAVPEGTNDWIARAWTIFGVALCIAIFVYLSIVARRAVDDELGDDVDDDDCHRNPDSPASPVRAVCPRPRRARDLIARYEEETIGFLDVDLEAQMQEDEEGERERREEMAHSPFASRVSSPVPPMTPHTPQHQVAPFS